MKPGLPEPVQPICALGCLFVNISSGRCLYLLRSERQRGHWGLPGGKQQLAETALQCLHREFTEELGSVPDYVRLVPLETFSTSDGHFRYVTFVAAVQQEFTPQLNSEHHGYCWVQLGSYPKPLHPGLWNTVNYPLVQRKIENFISVVADQMLMPDAQLIRNSAQRCT